MIKKGTDFTYWNKGIAAEIDFSDNKFNASTYIFYQCANDKPFELLERDIADQELKQLNSLSRIIQNDDELDRELLKWISRSQKYYNINIEPHSIRVLQALQNRSNIPSFGSKKKKLFLLNMLRCESHREILIQKLENEISNP